ncbi:hypothetical protein N7454_009429 [Penicillium verhagenii]|nr:hypothetical protein N7454_009429 [Penicillium verhagenii]
MAPPTRQPSRYRSAREGTHTGTEVGGGVVAKDAAARPPSNKGAQSNETNPSIARSMSRYRRNRPPASNTSMPVPAISNLAGAQPIPPLPGKINATFTNEEERIREKHRLDAMEQLTGGSQESEPTPSYWSRSAQSQKRRSKKVNKEEPAPMQKHESSQGARPTSIPSTNTGERKSFLQRVKLSRTKEPTHEAHLEPKHIGVGGSGIVPGTDAPKSAINAGERYVQVQYNNVWIDFAINPTTLVSDLLSSAWEQFPDIDPERFILLESFMKISLERPLRRYEYVRDVMNSWAQDSENRLIIIPPSSLAALDQVDPQNAPSERPIETTVHIYHSQRPRKWDKRYVTLRPDGQIFISKKENSKDHTNICHLSDYDIYSPSARALAKELKPPKKICFAIKSQQKSSMFLSTENFVHFFCTNDRAIADKWYQTVQQWRSWYLMKKTVGAAQSPANEAPVGRTLTMRAARNGFNDSPLIDRIPGDAEPLPRIRQSMDQPRAPSVKGAFSSHNPTWENSSPTGPFHETLTLSTRALEAHDDGRLVQGTSPEEIDAETFSPSGLLGRAYTQRHKSMRERQENEKRAKQVPSPSQWHPSEQMPPPYTPTAVPIHNNTLDRSKSVSHKGKPLIDLTPRFQEPPQHTRKGRGVTVEPGMALIDAATGPDLLPECMAIPPAIAWRRPSVPSVEIPPVPQTRHRAKSVRSVRPPTLSRADATPTTASPGSPGVPFLPNSLLASISATNPNTGQPPVGHGVATGDRNATRPLLDMSPDNPFQEGSLLRRL